MSDRSSGWELSQERWGIIGRSGGGDSSSGVRDVDEAVADAVVLFGSSAVGVIIGRGIADRRISGGRWDNWLKQWLAGAIAVDSINTEEVVDSGAIVGVESMAWPEEVARVVPVRLAVTATCGTDGVRNSGGSGTGRRDQWKWVPRLEDRESAVVLAKWSA